MRNTAITQKRASQIIATPVVRDKLLLSVEHLAAFNHTTLRLKPNDSQAEATEPTPIVFFTATFPTGWAGRSRHNSVPFVVWHRIRRSKEPSPQDKSRQRTIGPFWLGNAQVVAQIDRHRTNDLMQHSHQHAGTTITSVRRLVRGLA